MKQILTVMLLGVFALEAAANPQIITWRTNYSGQYARVYTTTARRSTNSSDTTWTNQSTPVYSDIAQVLYSASYVYVRAADLPSYRIGPWLNPQGAVGSLWPQNQALLHRFPRTTSVPATKTYTGAAYSGLFVNGVAVFNFADGKAWNNSALVNGPHFQSPYFWHQCAPVGEDYNFDYTLGHQTPGGVYHNHQQPIALRYQLGDHVDFNSSTKNYSESTNAVTAHSPILGWAYDGNPIYGPYGYSISNNASSGVRRMVPGYVQRNGSNGTDMVSTNLSVIPAWYARFRQSRFGGSYSTTAGTNRPAISSTYPLGNFAQDWAYLGDLTNAATGQLYLQGTNTFDLDVYNGRNCVTPEYPSGTYAYFVALDSSSNPQYPYTLGFEYYGNPTGGSVSSISESVTTNFTGASDFPLKVNSASVSNTTITLIWSSTEGGTYQIESSTNQSAWTLEKTNLAASIGVLSTNTYTSSVSTGTAYARVVRTAIATNNYIGSESGVVAQTNVISFLLANTAPTVANPISNQSATYGAAFSFTFPTNTFAESDSGQTLAYTASSSALTNSGIGFNAATRSFAATTVSATNGGTIATSYSVAVIATDDGSPAKSVTNTFTLTINKALASVTVSNASRVYGTTNATVTGSTSGFVAADSITASYGTTAATNNGTGNYSTTVVWSDPGTRLGNYTITTNLGTFTIQQAPLTVTAASVSRGYGVTNPVFSANYSGFVFGQTLGTSGVGGSPTLTTAATTNSSVGNYTITNSLGSLGSDNYSFTLSNGTLTVTQATLTATMTSTNRTYGAANPGFAGTVSGQKNNDAITISGGTTSATTNSAPGSYSIAPTFSDPGSKLGNYAVTTNTATLTIGKAALGVTANNAARAYGAANPVFASSYSGFMNNETSGSGNISGTPALTTTATTNSTVGSYTISNAVGSLTSAYYSFTFTNSTLTVTQTALTVTPANASRNFGAANPTFTGVISGIANSDNLTANYTTTATTNSPAGTYPITATVSDPGGKLPNYSVTTNLGTLTITNLITASNYTASLRFTNSLVDQAQSTTRQYTFTDSTNNLSIVVALTMTAYSASNGAASFNPLDFYGSINRYAHLGVESGLGGGDGNFVQPFEGANFSATLISASPGIATNSIKFGVAGVGFRFEPQIAWQSSARTATVTGTSETLFALDTTLAALSGSSYSATLRTASGGSDYQWSDAVDGTNYGLVVAASFFVGSESAANARPTVSLTTPTNGESFYAGDTHAIAASATSSNSTVVKVEFYEDGAKFAEDTSAPYTATWTNTYAGSHTLTARATDALGATNSASVSVTSLVYLRDAAKSGSTFNFKLYGASNVDYAIYSTSDLTNWAAISGANQHIGNGPASVILSNQPATNRFFRAKVD